MEPIVTIHPGRAAVLADVLADAARELTGRSSRLAALLAEHGEPLRPAVEVARGATVLAEEAVRIHRVIAEVRAWESAGASGGRVEVLVGSVTASHRRPVEAHRAARTVATSYRRVGAAAILDVDRAMLADPVFATTLLSLLGPEVLVEQLALVGATWGHPVGSIERSEAIAVAGVLAALLAATTREGAPAVSPDSLAAAAREAGVGPAVAGFLFLGSLEWETHYLVSLVDEIVVPVSREVAATGVAASAWFGSVGRAVDGRVLILGAVAERADASLAVARDSDLAALTSAGADFLDGGASIGQVLVAGTRPRADLDIGRLAPVATRVIEALVVADRVGSVPAGVQAELGELAAPWIGGLGATDFTAFGVPHPLPALGPRTAHDFLVLAMADRRASGDVEVALLGWARASLESVGRGTEPLVVKQVADVMRAVAEAARAVHLGDLASQDRDAQRLREHVDLAINALTLPMRSNPAGEATSVVVVAGMSHVVTTHLPAIDNELRYLRGLPASISQDQWALQYLVMAALWSRRDGNGLFAPLVGPPAPGQAGRPTDRPFLDTAGEMRPYSELDAAGRASFATWLYELDAAEAQVAQLVNAAGAEYGGSGG